MKFVCALIGIMLVSGCAPTQFRYNVSVNALSSPEFDGAGKYWLAPADKNITLGDLQFQEYATYVDNVLTTLGYQKATSTKKADLVLLLGYGISDPETYHSTYSVPSYGQTGVSPSTTYGTLNTYGNMGSYSSTTTYTPTYGITGYNTHVKTETLYTRFLSLYALDANNLDEQMWTLSASSTGGLGDLRSVFPVMLAASKDYIGMSTGSVLNRVIYVGDERINEVKGSIEPKATDITKIE